MDCENIGGASVCGPPSGTVRYYDPDQGLNCTRSAFRSAKCETAAVCRTRPAYFGISPKFLPTGSTAWRISRESSTAAWRCFTASR